MANVNPAARGDGSSRIRMGYAAALRFSTGIPGWLTHDQAAVLVAQASAVPVRDGGTVIEIGSHEGRSTVVLGASVPASVRVVAIDPFSSTWRYGSPGTERKLRSHLRAAGLEETVEVRVSTSRSVLSGWSSPVELVFVDGRHDVWSTIHDLGWARHLPLGGHLLVHDSFSSIGVTLALLLRVLPSQDLRYLSRTGSLAILERSRPAWRDRWRIVCQLPWWVRNVAVKILLRLRLRPAARLLGHHDAADPY